MKCEQEVGPRASDQIRSARQLSLSGEIGRAAEGRRRFSRRVFQRVSIFPVLLFLAGCEEPPPALETHSVTGKVTFSNGEPVQSGTIDFRSKRDQRLSMNAEILEDGTFQLATLHENQNLPGAVEGPCSAIVTVFLPGNPIPAIVDVPETFDVKPGGNEFHIQLKLPAPK